MSKTAVNIKLSLQPFQVSGPDRSENHDANKIFILNTLEMRIHGCGYRYLL
jgi:hypothetical protein